MDSDIVKQTRKLADDKRRQHAERMALIRAIQAQARIRPNPSHHSRRCRRTAGEYCGGAAERWQAEC